VAHTIYHQMVKMNSEKFEKKKKMEASGHVPIRGTV